MEAARRFAVMTRRLSAPSPSNQSRPEPPRTGGGGKGIGEGVITTMKLVADNVQGVVIPDSGHLVAEEAPDQLLAALTPFLAPYRAGSGR